MSNEAPLTRVRRLPPARDLHPALPVESVPREGLAGALQPLAFLWPQRRLILTTFLLIAAGSLFYVWRSVKPEYRSEATLQISPVIPRLVFETEDNGTIPLYLAYVNTKITILRSPVVLDRVLLREDVRKTSWYRKLPSARYEDLQDILMVAPKPKSELVDVTVTARKPDDAAVIANAVVDEFLTYLNQTARDTEQERLEKLATEREKRLGRIRELEGLVSGPRRALGTGNPDEMLVERSNVLDSMRADLLTMRRDIAMAEWQKRRLLGRDSDSAAQARPATSGGGEFYTGDAVWAERSDDVQMIRNQLAIESERLGEKHPAILELRKRLEFANSALQLRERQLSRQPPGATPAATTSYLPDDLLSMSPAALDERLELLRQRESLLAEDLKMLLGEYDTMLTNAELLKQRGNELKYEQDLYEAVRTRLAQKEVESQVLDSVKLLSAARPPPMPFRDRRMLFSALALVGALASGIGVAFVWGGLNPRVTKRGEIEVSTDAPMLGELPLVKSRQPLAREVDPVHAEAIRIVRTSLLGLIESEGARLFQIASAGPGVGKTEIAITLAKSLARCGKRVLLVDADLRTRELARRMGIPPGPGLTTHLKGGVNDREVIQHDVLPNLSVIPAGTAFDISHSELLANGVLSACLERWRQAFDVVIIDGPPVIGIADARILARRVDGTVFVVREGRCKRSDVFESIAAIERSGGRAAGMVYLGRFSREDYRYYGAYHASGSMDMGEIG